MDYHQKCVQILNTIQSTYYYILKDLRTHVRNNLDKSFIGIFGKTIDRFYHIIDYLNHLFDLKNNNKYYL